MSRILVVKLGAFGDFVHAFHAFPAIREHHSNHHVALLTTAPYKDLARASAWFDGVLVDKRAPWWNLRADRRTIGVNNRYDLVHNLQTSRLSGRY